MPTPVAHGLAGMILYTLPPWSPDPARERSSLGLAAFAAVAADLDFLPGLLLGDPSRFHHGVSHSVGAALVFGLVMALLAPGFLGRGYAWRAGVFASLYGSHLLLDFFAVDTSPPYGEPLFWPFSSGFFLSPWTPFPDVKHGRSWGAFLNWANARAVAVEAGLFVPLWITLLWARGALRRTHGDPTPMAAGIENPRGSKWGSRL